MSENMPKYRAVGFEETIQKLRDEIVVLTARAEIAEEDAAVAWATVVDVHRTWGQLGAGGDPDFVDRRNAFLAKAEAARVRQETQGGTA